MQEQQELLARCQKQEEEQKMLGKFVATLTEVMNHVVSLCSNIQDTSIVECGGLIEEHNEKENLELQGEGEELRQEVQ